MNRKGKTTNVVFSGLGGQGILTASDILADAAFRAGLDVKKSEIHGMSQRGGSVTSDVRFGEKVFSPMVPMGEADFLVVLDSTQVECSQPYLRPEGVLILCDRIDLSKLKNRKALNVSLLGALSAYLELDGRFWKEAICANLPEKLHAVNFDAFEVGRAALLDV